MFIESVDSEKKISRRTKKYGKLPSRHRVLKVMRLRMCGLAAKSRVLSNIHLPQQVSVERLKLDLCFLVDLMTSILLP